MNFWKMLVGPEKCPGCGEQYVMWTDSTDRDGHRLALEYHGCPRYRDRPAGLEGLDTMHRHGARLRVVSRTPLKEIA